MHLTAQIRPGLLPALHQGHAQQGDGYLLAGGKQHVHLASSWPVGHFSTQRQQTVGLATHGRHDHRYAIAALAATHDTIGYRADTLCVTNAGATIFLHENRHDYSAPNRSLTQGNTEAKA